MASEQPADVLKALKALIDAIDFEGENGRIRFPNSPWELDVLSAARAAVDQAEAA